MNQRLMRCAAVVAASIGLPIIVAAQPSPSAQAGFQAIILTPVGALPQTVLAGPWSGARRRFLADARYGSYRIRGGGAQFHNIGLGAQVRIVSRLSIGATLGSRTCDGCEGLKMAGVDLTTNLFHHGASESGGADTDLALQLGAGIGTPNQARFTARSLAARLPFTVTLPQASAAALTLFLSPGLAYGHINDGSGTVLGYNGGDGSTRFLIAAGMAYELAAGLGVLGAVQRVTIDDSPTQMGFGASWTFGPRRPRP